MGLKKYNVGDIVTFNFLGGIHKGIVIDTVPNENIIRVNYNGTIHRVGLTEKDNKYCYLENGI